MGDFRKDLEEAKAILYDHAAGNPELYAAIEIIERALEQGDKSEEKGYGYGKRQPV